MHTKKSKNNKPACPKCKSKKHVIKTEDQRTEFRLFVAKPYDDYFCTKCNFGF